MTGHFSKQSRTTSSLSYQRALQGDVQDATLFVVKSSLVIQKCDHEINQLETLLRTTSDKNEQLKITTEIQKWQVAKQTTLASAHTIFPQKLQQKSQTLASLTPQTYETTRNGRSS